MPMRSVEMRDTVPDRAAASSVVDVPGAERDDVRRLGAVLQAVAFAAERLSRGTSWDEAVDEVLQRMGQAAEVSRGSLCENGEQEGGGAGIRVCHEWTVTVARAPCEGP